MAGLAYACITIRGMVQGVGYRAFVARHARDLGLVGYAKNLYNGNVEVCVEGPRARIKQLTELLREGPYSAEVTDIEVVWAPYESRFRGFEIR